MGMTLSRLSTKSRTVPARTNNTKKLILQLIKYFYRFLDLDKRKKYVTIVIASNYLELKADK